MPRPDNIVTISDFSASLFTILGIYSFYTVNKKKEQPLGYSSFVLGGLSGTHTIYLRM